MRLGGLLGIDPHDVEAEVLAWIGLVGAVTAAIIVVARKTSTELARWLQDRADARVAELEKTVAGLRADLTALRDEVERAREEMRARDTAIVKHLSWDHQMITLLAASGHQDIPEPPPLYPDQAG